jgi:dihydrofolate reductase
MSDFIYYTSSSVNGFIADEHDSLQWLFDAANSGIENPVSFIDDMGVQVMGSSTYEWLLSNENLLEIPGKWQQVFGSLPTRVFSTRDLPRPSDADIEFLQGTVQSHLDDLRKLAGERDVWIVGGGDLAGQFYDAGSLDAIEVTIAPVFLPGGAPLLPRFIGSASLELVDTCRQGSFVSVRYHVVR